VASDETTARAESECEDFNAYDAYRISLLAMYKAGAISEIEASDVIGIVEHTDQFFLPKEMCLYFGCVTSLAHHFEVLRGKLNEERARNRQQPKPDLDAHTGNEV